MKEPTPFVRCVLVTLALLIPAAAAAQQHRGQIRGVVLDPSLAPIAGADVRVTSEATGQVRTT